jgi:predicted aminopeptidase
MKSVLSRTILLGISLLLLPACSTTQYYLQGASGHLSLMSQRQPISELLAGDSLSEKRRQQIEQVLSIRKFAQEKLKLPKNNSYSSFVELKREAISWNVIATPRYSMKPIQTCFPLVGCVSYLVYFTKKRAQIAAEKHKKLGHDTHIIASPAYSTLGLFDDPVVSTMFKGGISSTAEVVFHELAHQKLYRKNNSAFNEAFASTIGEEGTRLWLKENHPEQLKSYDAHIKKRWQFFNLIINTSKELSNWYASKRPDAEAEAGKQKIFKRLDHRYQQLKQSWGGDRRFDRWFKKNPVNNAKLAVIGVYYQQVPEFKRQLKAYNYDFDKFYQHYQSRKPAK